MSIIYNKTNVENVKFNGAQLDKVVYNGVTVWENWKEKTGTIGSCSASANNGWGDSGWIDLGKEIIPLEGDIYFSWSMSGGQYSTSCGASIGGKTVDGKEVSLFGHSNGGMGKDGSGSSTEHKTVNALGQVPIRYVMASCGGGTGGGSTSYRTSSKITKWKEKGS